MLLSSGKMNKAGNNVRKTSSPSVLLVGLEDEKEKIKDNLTRGTKDLDVVSIVGMGGIGKTTMARKLYQELERHFHVRAFCCVSQSYDNKKLLLDILPEVTKLPHNAEALSYEELSDILCRALKGRRYLIIMDDLWDTGAWNDLRSCFPNDHNQSRILFTSRQNSVVSQVKHQNVPHSLRLLNEQESWKLLEKAAFNQGSCPPDLLHLGWKIAKSCKGLPLAIVVVAGILASTEPEREKWEQLAESVSTDVQIECSHKFGISYNYLPRHLRPCFLYLAAFEEDAQIPVRKLMQFWVAEGFISGNDDRCLEDLAEDYLLDLIGRNLVMVSERRSDGGIKKCYMHDLMLDFCLEKSQEEKFMQRIEGNDWRSAFARLDASNLRLCGHYTGVFPKVSKFLFNPCLTSLLFFGVNYYESLEDYSFLCRLKHLTVLDLNKFRVYKDFFNMKLPTQLRYLAIFGYIECIPSSICRLCKLETLFLYQHIRPAVVHLPHSIWKMGTLRHLCGECDILFSLPNPRGKRLENLQNLSIKFWDEKNMKQILEAVPRLRRLKCFLPCLIGPTMGFVSQLESLHLCNAGLGASLSGIYLGGLPSNLKKLTITFVWICEYIWRLPNLEVLKILSGNFAEQRWCMPVDETFGKLKFLKLSSVEIEIWDASSKSFPCLEKLVVHDSFKLRSIPLSFGEIQTLRWIDVRGCRDSVASSVRQILEDQRKIGNDDLKVELKTDSDLGPLTNVPSGSRIHE